MALNLNNLELEVLKRWDEGKVFERSVAARKGKKPFVMWEGPPTANGKPGIHHVITRTFKDIVARFQTMAGRYVERKAGWDEHGLPVEIEVQKALDLKSKREIEDVGIALFNEACASSTYKYIGDWEALTRRMGYWVDMANAYRTSDPEYIRRVWDVLRQMMDKGLIYKAHKIVPWACDSGTVVSNAEVAQGYKEVTDMTAYVKFQMECTNAFFLAWTTTPWTLPANMALAVHPDLTYKMCRVGDENIISLMDLGPVVKTFTGRELAQEKYHFPFSTEKEVAVSDDVRPIFCADFVKDDKTGIVHIAPAFGQDDYELYQKEMKGTPIVCHVEPDGTFNKEAPEYLQGRKVFGKTFDGTNALVIRDIKSRGLLFRMESYTHQYPHNWRTGLPLIYYLRPSYYVAVNKIRDAMIAANDGVKWIPENVKNGRFGEWLRGDVDWSISRERYWGTPLPFYDAGNGPFFETPPGPHRPAADEPVWMTPHCTLVRTPEVLDCWFDSGAMPFAAFDKYEPADLICEAVDQTRGWFYSLMAIGVAMTGKAPYKRVLCLGHILDKEGQKMSKSKGNVVDPMQMFEKYGADAVRWYMAKNPIGNSMVFNEADIKTAVNGFLNRLWNCWSFYDMYLKIDADKFGALDTKYVNMTDGGNKEYAVWLDGRSPKPTLDIDKWILGQLEILKRACRRDYSANNIVGVTELIEKFVDNLSNVWVRANRDRFYTKDAIDMSAYDTLKLCLLGVCQVAAPIMPFMSDYIFSELAGGSVHMTDFPEPGTTTYEDLELDNEMMKAQTLIAQGRKARDEQKVKIRQPLATYHAPKKYEGKFKRFEWLVKEELNVKRIAYGEGEATFDFEITDDLLGEGLARDFVRVVQTLRKEAGLNVTDNIRLYVDYDGNERLRQLLDPLRRTIMDKVLAAWWTEGKLKDNTVKVDKYSIGLKVEKTT